MAVFANSQNLHGLVNAPSETMMSSMANMRSHSQCKQGTDAQPFKAFLLNTWR